MQMQKHFPWKRASRQAGVTVLEALMVIAILSLLVAMAVPSFASMTHTNKLASAVNLLSGAVQTARSESIKLNVVVKMCAARAGTVPACASSPTADWSNGWLLYKDADGDGVPNVGADIISSVLEPAQGLRLSSPQPDAAGAIAFYPNGTVLDAGTGVPPAWSICLPAGGVQMPRGISLTSWGHVTVLSSASALSQSGLAC